MKLLNYGGEERKGVIAIGYEHSPPRIDVSVLVSAFELIVRDLLKLPLGKRTTASFEGCVHPVHQRVTVFGWEVDPR
jgi:hypothetical protein